MKLQQSTPANPRYELHHFAHTSRQPGDLEPFYVDLLGLSKIREEPGERMTFLAAPLNMNSTERTLMPLELFGPPGLWDVNEEFLLRRDPGLQYLCFAVDNVDAAHADLYATEQLMSCPQHIGDLILPWPFGHFDTCTDVPSPRLMESFSSGASHFAQLALTPMPHLSHS